MKLPLFAGIVFCHLASALVAQVPTPKILSQTDTEWKGVTFAVTDIARVDDTHIVVQVRISADATAAYPTFIGLPPPAGWLPPHPTLEQLRDEKYLPLPFSLASGHLLDQKSGMEYPALGTLPPAPFWGSNSIMTNLGPDTWVQLAVQFNAPPPPPPGPDGKIEDQKVSLFFPKAKSPIKNLILPPIPTK